MESNSTPRKVIIAGAGPAGLTAAYELCRRGHAPVVYEKHRLVGGHARTEEFIGYRFDIGGHRFFTKIRRVDRIWREVLGERFLRVRRLSRIYYDRRFFHYPLKLGNVVRGLGIWNSFLILLSFLHSIFFPYRTETNLEQWVSNRFGKRLYRMFFKTYTEKVWGIPCSEIQAEWAAQRIKGLSLRTAVLNAVRQGRKNSIKSLIEEFDYPELGPGMMWEAFRDRIVGGGGAVHLNSEVLEIERRGHRVKAFVIGTKDGKERVCGTDFISSMPLPEVIARMTPAPPHEVLQAARGLKYRDFLTVCLIIDHPSLFPDNWIYIHSPEVRMGRLQNFKNWSARMVPDPSKSSVGAEYFATVDDDLWRMTDEDLVRLAAVELEQVGLLRGAAVEGGVVCRQKKAYPIYDDSYRAHLSVITPFLQSMENLQMIGRNGLHKYNNQDHSMLTALLAVENLFGACHNIWEINTEQSYQEEDEER